MSIYRLSEAQLAAHLAMKAQRAMVPREKGADWASVVLPWPPSVNHSTAPTASGGRRLTAAHKAFRCDVAVRVVAAGLHHHPLAGRLRVTMHATPPDARRRDIDNVQKAVLDALQHAGLYADDAAIDDLRILRIAGAPGTVNVYVETITIGQT